MYMFYFSFSLALMTQNLAKKWQVSKGESTWKTVLDAFQLLSRLQLPVHKTAILSC